MPNQLANLRLAQDYIRSVETKDLAGVSATLAENVQQIFMHTSKVKHPTGVAELKSHSARHGICVALFKGKTEVVEYTSGLMDNFSRLVWVDTSWTASPDGESIFFYGMGDMITAKSGKPYRNFYVTKFEIENGKIATMIENGDATLYAKLWIRPNRWQLRALGRALVHMLPFVSRDR